MLPKSASDAIKALLELASAPELWHSTPEIASSQQLKEPMLEQLMLRLRRAGLVQARRGRSGGYRLARPPARIPVAEVLRAVQAVRAQGQPPDTGMAADQVTLALERRLQRALRHTLEELSLEELLFDLRSAEASRDDESGLLLG